MTNNLASFAIHADDVQRCRHFYEAVFGWRFEPWGPPDFYLVHTGDEQKPGVQGLMHKRQTPRGVGGPNCFECTIAVDDLDETLARLRKHGAELVSSEVVQYKDAYRLCYIRGAEGLLIGLAQELG